TSPGSLLYCQNKNRLLNYLGKKGGSRPYCKVIPDEGIDALIIGSDGAFGSLSVAEIAQCFLSEKKPQDMIQRLLDKAREKGEEDNQTVILYIPGTNKREKKSETENTEKLREEKQETECCYTSLEEKKTGFLRDKFRKNRFTGGR
ncbi:MAG: hypothetical protein MR867_05170, partial [Eubacterium sp.]|nr:hypothetical protein [Eubacterium sp.]